MLISCPTCPKVYRVAASAIPPEGREVRCSACGSVWHEHGIEAELLDNNEASLDDSSSTLKSLAKMLEAHGVTPEMTLSEIEHFGEAPPTPPPRPAAKFNRSPKAIAPNRAMVISPPSATLPALASKHASDSTADAGSASTQDSRPASRALVDRIKMQWSSWREARDQAKAVPPGNAAARAFRERAQMQARNRLTPVRAAGWVLWAGTAAILAWGGMTQVERVQSAFPASENLYARLMPAPQSPLAIVDLTTRYVESIAGPVLEISGTVINEGHRAEVPTLELLALDQDGAVPQPVSISPVPLPKGGTRPFVVRAQMPEGTTRASLKVSPSLEQGRPQHYVMQQVGSGWGEALPPSISGVDRD